MADNMKNRRTILLLFSLVFAILLLCIILLLIEHNNRFSVNKQYEYYKDDLFILQRRNELRTIIGKHQKGVIGGSELIAIHSNGKCEPVFTMKNSWYDQGQIKGNEVELLESMGPTSQGRNEWHISFDDYKRNIIECADSKDYLNAALSQKTGQKINVPEYLLQDFSSADEILCIKEEFYFCRNGKLCKYSNGSELDVVHEKSIKQGSGVFRVGDLVIVIVNNDKDMSIFTVDLETPSIEHIMSMKGNCYKCVESNNGREAFLLVDFTLMKLVPGEKKVSTVIDDEIIDLRWGNADSNVFALGRSCVFRFSFDGEINRYILPSEGSGFFLLQSYQ